MTEEKKSPKKSPRKAIVRFPAPGLKLDPGGAIKINYDGVYDPATLVTTIPLSDGGEYLVSVHQALTKLLPEG
jgi:hypothetical protein